MRHLYWIASCVALLILSMIARMASKEVRRTARSRRFMWVLGISICLISVDVIWVLSEINVLILPPMVDAVLAALYYTLTGATAYGCFLYSEEMQSDGRKPRMHLYERWMILPVVLLLILSVLSIFYGWIFRIGTDGIHMRGPIYFVQAFIGAFYLLVTGVKAIIRATRRHNPYERHRYLTISVYSMTVLVMSSLQVLVVDVPFLNIGITFGVLQAYFFINSFEREQFTNYSKIKSFSKLFLSAYYVDMQERTLERIDIADHIKNSASFDEHRQPHVRPYDRAMAFYIKTFVHPLDAEMLRDHTTLDYMEEHLSSTAPYYYINYRQVIGDECKWYRMYVVLSTLLDRDVVGNAVVCVMDVDEEQRLMIRSDYFRNMFTSAATDVYERILQIYPSKDRVYLLSFNNGELVKEDTQRNIREHLESFYASVLPEFRDEVMRKCYDILQNPELTEVSYGYKGMARVPGVGSLRWYTTTIRAIRYEGERVLMAFITDNTEKIKALELLEERRRTEKMNDFIVNVLSSAVEFRSMETGDHIHRVTELTYAILQEMMVRHPICGITEEQAKLISRAAALHDLGKIAIADQILLKPDRLTAEEFEEMKKHTVYGCNILDRFENQDDPFFRYCYDICRYHHERYDGKGYPDGLAGDQIPLWAQVVSIVDVYDALINSRSYKAAYTHEESLRMIREGECGVFSPEVQECFEKAIGRINGELSLF